MTQNRLKADGAKYGRTALQGNNETAEMQRKQSVKDRAGPEKLEEISGVKYGEGVEEARRGEACSSERKAGGKDCVVGTMGICKRAAVKGQ